MNKYSSEIVSKIRKLRSSGKTYSEIKESLGIIIAKSTLSDLCKGVILPQEYREKIMQLNVINSHKGRSIALISNKLKRKKLLDRIDSKNIVLSHMINNEKTAKIALAMLCLGEASKSKRSTSFYFGNSNAKTIVLFLQLLKKCFTFSIEKVRCTVQCRADQDTVKLENFWVNITNIPKRLFYRTRIDPRTKGKPTKNNDYKGVLRIDYFDNNVRLELESLIDLLYNQLIKAGPVA